MYIAVVSDQLGIEISLPVARITSDIQLLVWPTIHTWSYCIYMHLDYFHIYEIWCAIFFLQVHKFSDKSLLLRVG